MAKITHIFKTFYPDEPDGGIQEVIHQLGLMSMKHGQQQKAQPHPLLPDQIPAAQQHQRVQQVEHRVIRDVAVGPADRKDGGQAVVEEHAILPIASQRPLI